MSPVNSLQSLYVSKKESCVIFLHFLPSHHESHETCFRRRLSFSCLCNSLAWLLLDLILSFPSRCLGPSCLEDVSHRETNVGCGDSSWSLKERFWGFLLYFCLRFKSRRPWLLSPLVRVYVISGVWCARKIVMQSENKRGKKRAKEWEEEEGPFFLPSFVSSLSFASSLFSSRLFSSSLTRKREREDPLLTQEVFIRGTRRTRFFQRRKDYGKILRAWGSHKRRREPNESVKNGLEGTCLQTSFSFISLSKISLGVLFSFSVHLVFGLPSLLLCLILALLFAGNRNAFKNYLYYEQQ